MIPFRQFILIPYSTILIKEVTRFMRIWLQSLLPPAITMSLYFIIFGHFIGSQLNEIHGVSYMQFIAPGLIMMAVITNSYSNVVTSLFTARMLKNIEEILISPTPNWVIISGYVSAGILRGLFVGALVTIVSLFFTHLKIYNIGILILTVFLAALLFALAGFANGIFAKKFDDISIIPTFVLTPLTYLGGIFYSIDNLPPIWKTISYFNPILYMVNTFRYGFIGVTDTPIPHAFLMVIASIIVLITMNLILLHKGVGFKT